MNSQERDTMTLQTKASYRRKNRKEKKRKGEEKGV